MASLSNIFLPSIVFIFSSSAKEKEEERLSSETSVIVSLVYFESLFVYSSIKSFIAFSFIFPQAYYIYHTSYLSKERDWLANEISVFSTFCSFKYENIVSLASASVLLFSLKWDSMNLASGL